MKRCRTCGVEKPLSEFGPKRFASGNVGHRCHCRQCVNDKGRDKAREDRRKQRATDPAAFRKYAREYAAKKRATGERGEQKKRYLRAKAEKEGRAFLTREERATAKQERQRAQAEAQAERARQPKKENRKEMWVKRLREELPALYDPSLCIDSLAYRARYNLDDSFKAREITRAAKADSRAPLFDDGSLTSGVVCSLFSVKDCPYCGKRMASQDKTLDHITPRWRGGWHSAKNVIVCCFSCNSRKRAKTPDEWLNSIDESRKDHVRRAWAGVGATSTE